MNKVEIKTNEVLLKDNNEWLYFSNPHQIVRAERLEDVRPALREVEQLITTNSWYAAGFLSYEAAPAFDPALQTYASLAQHSTRDSEFPYLWFGLYSKPRMVELPTPEQARVMLNWQPAIDRETYNSAIARIKDHIVKGRT